MTNKPSHKIILLLILIATLGLFLWTPMTQAVAARPAAAPPHVPAAVLEEEVSAPPRPARFYGTATLGGSSLPPGTAVSAWISGTQYAQTVTFLNEDEQSVYWIDVPGDIPTTPLIEGGQDNQTVTFQVGTAQVNQTGLWQDGPYTPLPLNVTDVVNLAVTQDNGRLQLLPNDITTYTLTIHNQGLTAATGVILTDTLPPPTSFLAATGTHANGVVTWNLGTIAAGATVTETVTVQVNGHLNGITALTNTAVVHDDGSHGPDFNLVDNTAIDTDTIPTPTATFFTANGINVASLVDGAAVVEVTNEGFGDVDGIIDNNQFSSWTTNYGYNSNQWVKIDLVGEEAAYISEVVLLGSNQINSVKDFEIRISATGTADTDFITVLADTLPQDNNAHTYTLPPIQAKYVQLYVVNNWGSSNINLKNFQVKQRSPQGGIVSLLEGDYPPPLVDFSSLYHVNSPPEYALDNDMNTYWRANGATNNWLTIELADSQVHTIGGLILKTIAAAYAVKDFEIQVSTTTTDDLAFTTVFSSTAVNSNDIQTFTFPSVPAKYVRLYILNNYNYNYFTQLGTFYVTTPEGHIVQSGLNAVAIDQSSQSSSSTRWGSQAIDYSTSTYWETASGSVTDQWLKVRLSEGKSYLINRIKLQAEDDSTAPQSFEIRVSNDGTDDAAFTTVLTGTLPADGYEHWFTFDPVPARYVQLYIHDNHGHTSVIRVHRFQVYAMNRVGPIVPFLSDLSSPVGGTANQWHWDFGDGTTATDPHPIHTYAGPGTYPVTLTITDTTNLAATQTVTYTILPYAPLAFDWTPVTPQEGEQTTFTDQSTPSPNTLFLTRKWQFTHTTVEPTSETTIQTFPDNGSYIATLTRMDTNFIITTLTHTITPSNVTPVADAGVDQTVPISNTWKTNASATDAGPTDRNSLLCHWDFGDGQSRIINNCNTSSADVTHDYTATGIYTGTLTVTDKDGAAHTDSLVTTIRQRQTMLSIFQVQSLSAVEAEVKMALWDVDANTPMPGWPITLHWNGQVMTPTTDSEGIATVVLPIAPEEAISLTAVYAGDYYYEAQTMTVNTVVDTATVEYWLGFVAHTISADVDLQIASEYHTAGVVRIPGLNFFAPFTVAPGEVAVIDLPVQVLMDHVSSGFSNKGIYVTAINDILVYGMSYHQYTTDAFMGFAVEDLGTEYLVVSRDGLFDGSQFLVVGTEDNTTVAITPTLGSPYTVTLNQGQTYHTIAKDTGGDFTGSVIRASAPVAVFGGHTCAYVPDSVMGQWCNHLIEQLFPVETWGRAFATMPLAGRNNNGDRIRMLASVDNTHVTINETQVITLNRGQHHEILANTPTYITADQPIIVTQFAQGARSSGLPGDPSMMLIPPYEQFRAHYPGILAAQMVGFVQHYVNVVAPEAAVGAITLDGVPIPATDYVPIGSSGFWGTQVNIALGTHTLDGPLPFGLFMYGYGDYDIYSYPGGFDLSDAALAAEVILTPETANQAINQPHCVTAVVNDQDGQPLDDIRVDFVASGIHQATGFNFTNSSGTADFCYTGTTLGSDTITATVSVFSDTAAITWIDVPFDLQLSKSDGGITAVPGSPITYTLSYSNAAGTDTVPNATLTETVPAHTAFNAATSSPGWSCADGSPAGTVCTLALGDVTTSTLTASFGITVSASLTQSTLITNTATIAAAGSEPNTSNNTASVTTLVFVNTAPTAVADTVTTPEDTAVIIAPLTNDSDVDGHPLTVDTITAPSSGTAVLNGDNTVTYTPTLNVNGDDSFIYTISDGSGGADTATVTITITPVNDDPIAVADTATTPEDTAVTITPLTNDTDVDGDTLTVDAITTPSNGTAAINGDNSVTYTPTIGFTGVATFTYTLSDGQGGFDTATITITVTAATGTPVACDVQALIDAIHTTNNTPGADTIRLSPDCVYTLTAVDNVTEGPNGLPAITDILTIQGQGATIERDPAAPNFRILYADADLTLQTVTIQNGTAVDTPGGGLYAEEPITLTMVTVQNNQTLGLEIDGGGVYADDTAVINDSTFLNNDATNDGGGVFVDKAAAVYHSTFSGNTSIENGAGLFADDVLIVTHSTFSQNSAQDDGGAIYANKILRLQNSIFVENYSDEDGGALYLVAEDGGHSLLINNLWLRNTADSDAAAICLMCSSLSVASASVDVFHNTLVGDTAVTPESALEVAMGTVSIQNTIITHHEIGVTNDAGAVTTDSNLYFGNTTDEAGTITSSNHITGQNPLFADAANDDYHLQSGSPALDNGADAGVITDLDDISRPQGAGYDRGAYEAYNMVAQNEDEWQAVCAPNNQTIDIVGVGMGHAGATTNPATLTLADTTDLDSILAQVVVNNYSSLQPDQVILSSSGETITLLTPSSGGGYNYEEVMPPATAITAEVIGTGNGSEQTPRAFIAYLFRDGDGSQASSGRLIHADVFENSHSERLTIPTASFSRDVVITFAVSDMDADSRVAILQATAGGVSQTVTVIQPNQGDGLLLYQLVLPAVPGSVDTVTLTLDSPVGTGDSLYWSGVTVTVPCQEVTATGRVTDGLQSLYTFQEGSGSTANNVTIGQGQWATLPKDVYVGRVNTSVGQTQTNTPAGITTTDRPLQPRPGGGRNHAQL